jgi:hypothetical protein
LPSDYPAKFTEKQDPPTTSSDKLSTPFMYEGVRVIPTLSTCIRPLYDL